MKIVCKKIISSITNEVLESSPWVTVGDEYIVLALEVNFQKNLKFLIQSDDYGDPIFEPLEGFEISSYYIPSSWVINVDPDREAIMIMPKSWQYESFFGDLEDEEVRAIELFTKEAELIYSEEAMASPEI